MNITSLFRRAALITTSMALLGCSPPTSGVVGPPGTVLALIPTDSGSDFERLFAESCHAERGSNLVRQAIANLRCDTPATAQDTATLLLAFDGSLNDLPVLSLQQVIRPTAEDRTISLLSVKFFARVPQERGQALRVVPSRSRFMTDLSASLTQGGAILLAKEADVAAGIAAIEQLRAQARRTTP